MEYIKIKCYSSQVSIEHVQCCTDHNQGTLIQRGVPSVRSEENILNIMEVKLSQHYMFMLEEVTTIAIQSGGWM